MHGAGQRHTKPPERYNPSVKYPPLVLPVTDFDLTMENQGDDKNASLEYLPLVSLSSLKRQMDDMNEVFHQQLDSIAQRYQEIDNKIAVLCTRIDEIDSETATKVTQVQTECQNNFRQVQKDITTVQTSGITDNINYVNNVQRSINESIQALSDRVCGIEGQAARLAAVENKIQNTTLNPPIADQSALFKKKCSILSNFFKCFFFHDRT